MKVNEMGRKMGDLEWEINRWRRPNDLGNSTGGVKLCTCGGGG